MNEWLDMFASPFMQRALVAGLLVALVSSYFGVFVVQRGMSFLGNGLAHAAFGGVALALYVGGEPVVYAAGFTVVVALAIQWFQRRSGLARDTSIGVFFSLSMALGIVLLARREGYTAEAVGYLFGDILLIGSADLWAAGVAALLIPLSLPLWGRWAYATFDRELAAADGVPVERDDYLLTLAIALTIVVAVKIVGIVLIAAFLVVPAAAARLIASTFGGMTLLSVLLALGSVFVGLVVSYRWDLPSGASIILVQAAVLFALLPFRRG